MYSLEEIQQTDKEIADLIQAEVQRQNSHIELIASENWVSRAVMAAMGSPLTNKYAEGYPGKRFYGGCACVDEVEQLAIDRAKELFGCEYVNVQLIPEPGKHGSIFCNAEAGGYRAGHGSCPRRPSDTWKSGKYVRYLFPCGFLWSK